MRLGVIYGRGLAYIRLRMPRSAWMAFIELFFWSSYFLDEVVGDPSVDRGAGRMVRRGPRPSFIAAGQIDILF